MQARTNVRISRVGWVLISGLSLLSVILAYQAFVASRRIPPPDPGPYQAIVDAAGNVGMNGYVIVTEHLDEYLSNANIAVFNQVLKDAYNVWAHRSNQSPSDLSIIADIQMETACILIFCWYSKRIRFVFEVIEDEIQIQDIVVYTVGL